MPSFSQSRIAAKLQDVVSKRREEVGLYKEIAEQLSLSLLSTVKMKLIRTQTGYPSAQHNQEQWLASSRNLVNKLSTAELSTWFKMHRI